MSYWFKSKSSEGDLTKTFVQRHSIVKNGIVVTQLVLTDHPEGYYGYKIIRKFFNKFVLQKTEVHTAQTWWFIGQIIQREFIKLIHDPN